MKILCGIDIVEVWRIEKNIQTKGFCERVFTPDEIKYCRSRKLGQAQSYAARFAAKEAFSKALGTGITKGISFTDIEVGKKDQKPVLILHNKALELLAGLGECSVDLSISHTKETAAANVVILVTNEKGG